MRTTLNIQQWDQAQFSQSENIWQDLLKKSSADPLFMSWHWHHQWWQLYAQENQLELCLLACYRDNRLIGLAPLYRYKTTVLRYFPIKRLGAIGSKYRHALGIRAEYQSFICEHDDVATYEALWAFIFESLDWQEAFFSDIPIKSQHYQSLQASRQKRKAYQRIDSQEASYSVNTQGSFEHYLGSLGKNTRLKLFNRRKRLEEQGSVALSHISTEDYDALLKTSNRFHKTRWGKIGLSETKRRFIKNIMQVSDSQASVASLLTLNGSPLSTMLNLQFNGRIYNIQLTFMEEFDRKISLGTLHLGYAIENAFHDPAIHYFDLLAGTGKNHNYKSHIAQKDVTMVSIQIVQSPLLKCLYRLYDYSKMPIKMLNRLKKTAKNAMANQPNKT